MEPVLSLLALGPNPALQRVMTFDTLQLGEVNRAISLSQYVGGKGQGVALALQRWSPADHVMVAQFLGGDSGRFVEKGIEVHGIEQITQRGPAEAPPSLHRAVAAAMSYSSCHDPDELIVWQWRHRRECAQRSVIRVC